MASGLGFAWLPRHAIEHQLAQRQLLLLPLQQGTHRSHYMYLYANKDKPLGPATRILADLLIEHSMTN